MATYQSNIIDKIYLLTSDRLITTKKANTIFLNRNQFDIEGDYYLNNSIGFEIDFIDCNIQTTYQNKNYRNEFTINLKNSIEFFKYIPNGSYTKRKYDLIIKTEDEYYFYEDISISKIQEYNLDGVYRTVMNMLNYSNYDKYILNNFDEVSTYISKRKDTYELIKYTKIYYMSQGIDDRNYIKKYDNISLSSVTGLDELTSFSNIKRVNKIGTLAFDEFILLLECMDSINHNVRVYNINKYLHTVTFEINKVPDIILNNYNITTDTENIEKFTILLKGTKTIVLYDVEVESIISSNINNYTVTLKTTSSNNNFEEVDSEWYNLYL